jgi:hypothetical protein
MPNHQLIATEFALGRVLAVTPLAGGPDVVKLSTTGGTWVVKPCLNRTTAELYPRVASALNAAGLRQALPPWTAAGSPVSASGYPVQEFLPGRICLQPTAAQIAATMRYIAEYHRVLEEVPPPAELRVVDSIWNRVASVEYLLERLPGLLRAPGTWPGLPTDCRQTVEAALGLVRDRRPLLNRLPRQVVHGDIGPDNVLMDGGRVVSIVDFTPYDEPFLFALSSAVYWYHIYGRDVVDLDSVRGSLAVTGTRRPLTEVEAAAWPAMFVREALRRLTTSLAVADQAGTGPDTAAVVARYRALRSVCGRGPRCRLLLGHFLRIQVIQNGQIRTPEDCNTHKVVAGSRESMPVTRGVDSGRVERYSVWPG